MRALEVQPIALICTDFSMPGMDGLELLRRAHELSPRVCGVLVTGFKEQLPRGVAGDEAVFAVVYKPYEFESLLTTLRDAVRVSTMTRVVSGFSSRAHKLNGGVNGG